MRKLGARKVLGIVPRETRRGYKVLVEEVYGHDGGGKETLVEMRKGIY